MKTIVPNADHIAARLAMIRALKAFNLSPMEMLAVMSHTVGQLLAMQDQRTVTPSMAMELISTNIEIGNAEAVENMLATKGSA